MLDRILAKVRDRIRTDDVIDFGAFRLHIDPRDVGGRMYRDSGYRADLFCPLHREIVASLRPATYIDIGANYGFTALVHHALNPGARIVAVEPSSKVLPYLRRNLTENADQRGFVVAALCGDQIADAVPFALNPIHSQDSRVAGEAGWRIEQVQSVTLASLMKAEGVAGPFLIKIDTQGFEERVLRGGFGPLRDRSDWLIKMEFAPAWLEKQGTDPVAFLESLCGEFHVSEWPRRARYTGDTLATQDRARIQPASAAAMIDHVRRLSMGAGWTDLLVRPGGLPNGPKPG